MKASCLATHGELRRSDCSANKCLSCQTHVRRFALDWPTLTSWRARPDILRDTSSELFRSVRVEEVDEGKTGTGTMLEVHGDKIDQSS